MQLRYQDWIFAISLVMAFHAYSMGIQWYRSAHFGGIAHLTNAVVTGTGGRSRSPARAAGPLVRCRLRVSVRRQAPGRQSTCFAHSPYAFDLRYAFETTSQGERLLVVGDSFTHAYWERLLKHTGAAGIAWIPFSGCTFDFTDLARFAPTHVIVAPTERNIACGLTNWPHGLPRDPAAASR
jgi:hypothetical protein